MKKSELRQLVKEIIQESRRNSELEKILKKDKNLKILQPYMDGFLVKKKNPLIGALKGVSMEVFDVVEDDGIYLAKMEK